jgi:hypothetical protein
MNSRRPPAPILKRSGDPAHCSKRFGWSSVSARTAKFLVGPVGSAGEALALLPTADLAAAILDVNLADGDCSALVEALVVLDIPIIVQ